MESFTQVVYSLILIIAYAAAIRFTLVYIGVMAGKVQTFRKYDAWIHALSIAIIINDFFDIFRW